MSHSYFVVLSLSVSLGVWLKRRQSYQEEAAAVCGRSYHLRLATNSLSPHHSASAATLDLRARAAVRSFSALFARFWVRCSSFESSLFAAVTCFL